MALVTANGRDVFSGSVVLPLSGVWTADLVIDGVASDGFAAGDQVKIEAPNLTLVGSVSPSRTGDFLDTLFVRVLGGVGGISKPVTPRNYVQPQAFGRDVVNGLAKDSGETISSTADQSILSDNLVAWSVTSGKVGGALELLLDIIAPDAHWRILADGTLWFGREDWRTVTVENQILTYDPSTGKYDLGVDAPSVIPGVSLDEIGHVARVEHTIENDRIRTYVWNEAEDGRGIFPAVDRIVQHLVRRFDHMALYRCKIISQAFDLSTVDVQMEAPDDQVLAGFQRVPVRTETGIKLKFSQGSSVLLGWEGGDPRAPFVVTGLGSDAMQEIQIGGTTPASRKGDHSDAGTWVFAFSPGVGGATLSIVYTDPDGSVTSLPPTGGNVSAKAKLTEGSSIVKVG